MATLHAAEKILMTDFPIIPIYYCTSPVLLNKHIRNEESGRSACRGMSPLPFRCVFV